jgi:asparagine synthase (glutamine-hydrolysing)
MCGIAGIIRGHGPPIDPSQIVAMSERLVHRGPDGFGYLIVGSRPEVYLNRVPDKDITGAAVVFAHRRLAILDRSEAGLQPMRSADGRLFLVFNGEIYNYRELREELRSRGFRFDTGTDSEVVLAAFSCWGVGCFSRFNGMWAVAIYDTRDSTVTISRDRLGVKPLYLRSGDGSLSFASEIKALNVGRSVSCDSGVMDRFLRFGIVGTDERTFFEEVVQFPAGCYAQVRASNLRVEPVAYWSPAIPNVPEGLGVEDVIENVRCLFEDSVRLRLRSDVPVGFCLSGGLDSSSIVGVAGKLLGSGSPLSTFHARSDDPRFDESAWAGMVNEHVCATPYFVTPDVETMLHDLDRLIWHQDEPFPTLSIFAQWLLMKKARSEGVPVLLDGQGGDELFAGYRKYLFAYTTSLIRRRDFRRLASTLGGFYSNGDRGVLNLLDGLKYMPAFLRGATESLESFMRPCMETGVTGAGTGRIKVPSDVRRMSVMDLTSTSLPSLLRYEDRNSMAWSIEAREPFLDFRLVEFALSIPDESKIANGRLKYALREAMRPYLPQRIIDRRDKVGFVTAELGWLRSTMMPEVISEVLSGRDRLSEWVDVAGILAKIRGGAKLSLPLERGLIRLFIASRWLGVFSV